MSMPAYIDDPQEMPRFVEHIRRQLPVPVSSTDLFLAAILEEIQSQGRQIGDLQDELIQARTDLALIRAAIPPESPVSADGTVESIHSEAPLKAPESVASDVPERLMSRRRGNHRR